MGRSRRSKSARRAADADEGLPITANAAAVLGLPRPIDDAAVTHILATLGAIPGRKIVTWVGVLARGSFDMLDTTIETTSRTRLAAAWTQQPLLSVAVRQFLAERHGPSGLPVKQLYGFLYTHEGGFRKLPAAEYAQMYGEPEESEVLAP